MNEYIFYTTEGFTYPPIEGKDVENCQVLGQAFGNNVQDAKTQLEKRCPWIKDCGFDIEEAISKQVLTEENKKDINMVLEYLMEEEFKHYQEAAEPENHIYKVLLRLKDMIC